MNVPPNTLVQDGLPARIETQDSYYMRICTDLHRQLFPPSDAAHLDVAGGVAVYVEPGSPLSKATGVGMSGPVTAAAFDQLEDFYRTRGGIVRVDLCPHADATLQRELSLRGYRPDDWKNIFVREVTKDDATRAPDPGIEVREVEAGERDAWVQVVSDGFNERPGQPNPHHQLYQLLGDVPGNVLFLAQIDGQPAGGACIGLEGGLASMVSTSVLPRFRRRGVHAALLCERLRWAATQGVPLIRIAANPGSDSERNIERFGFRVVYSRLVVWRDLAGAAERA